MRVSLLDSLQDTFERNWLKIVYVEGITRVTTVVSGYVMTCKHHHMEKKTYIRKMQTPDLVCSLWVKLNVWDNVDHYGFRGSITVLIFFLFFFSIVMSLSRPSIKGRLTRIVWIDSYSTHKWVRGWFGGGVWLCRNTVYCSILTNQKSGVFATLANHWKPPASKLRLVFYINSSAAVWARYRRLIVFFYYTHLVFLFI